MSIAGSDPIDQPSTRVHTPRVQGENTEDMVGPGIQTQDLSDKSLPPYRSELSGQPTPKEVQFSKDQFTYLCHPVGSTNH